MSRNLNKILNYSLLKISLIPIMLWIISSLVFILLRVAPGDPVDAILGSGADEVSREFLRNKLGLNEPLINQYFSYIKNILHLDFGQSLSTQEPVLNIIIKSLPASLELGFFSILSATLIGFPLGLIGLRNRGKKTDYIARILGISTYFEFDIKPVVITILPTVNTIIKIAIVNLIFILYHYHFLDFKLYDYSAFLRLRIIKIATPITKIIGITIIVGSNVSSSSSDISLTKIVVS